MNNDIHYRAALEAIRQARQSKQAFMHAIVNGQCEKAAKFYTAAVHRLGQAVAHLTSIPEYKEIDSQIDSLATSIEEMQEVFASCFIVQAEHTCKHRKSTESLHGLGRCRRR